MIPILTAIRIATVILTPIVIQIAIVTPTLTAIRIATSTATQTPIVTQIRIVIPTLTAIQILLLILIQIVAVVQGVTAILTGILVAPLDLLEMARAILGQPDQLVLVARRHQQEQLLERQVQVRPLLLQGQLA